MSPRRYPSPSGESSPPSENLRDPASLSDVVPVRVVLRRRISTSLASVTVVRPPQTCVPTLRHPPSHAPHFVPPSLSSSSSSIDSSLPSSSSSFELECPANACFSADTSPVRLCHRALASSCVARDKYLLSAGCHLGSSVPTSFGKHFY